jgi:hypothetical protein
MREGGALRSEARPERAEASLRRARPRRRTGAGRRARSLRARERYSHAPPPPCSACSSRRSSRASSSAAVAVGVAAAMMGGTCWLVDSAAGGVETELDRIGRVGSVVSASVLAPDLVRYFSFVPSFGDVRAPVRFKIPRNL